MSIIAIAAVDADWGIGYNGELLERIPADMKFFKETTMNSVVIMGRKTWDSLPKKPLIDRDNIIITSKPQMNYEYPAFVDFNKIKQILTNATSQRDIYIIGGASIYKQLLPYCDKAYITKIYKSHENVDSYFPNLDQMENEWELIEKSSPANYKNFYYSFTTYQRIN